MASVAKVTALITRLGDDGPEACVFDHPYAGVQLPGGRVESEESVAVATLREAFEETGLFEVRIQSEPIR